MQDATIARGEDVTANVRGDEDTRSLAIPLWGVYKDYTLQRSTTTTQGVVVSRYPTDARTDGFIHLNN